MPTDISYSFIFDNNLSFAEKALTIFRWQAAHCKVYQQYLQLLKIAPESIDSIDKIPFLPIQFFKTQTIISSEKSIEKIFTSSATSGMQVSQHHVADLKLYEQNAMQCFQEKYGNIDEYCILALLPAYLERGGSSLIDMVEKFMAQSNHPQNGFYLNDFEKLNQTILHLENQQQKTLLIGVTFALLDFVEQFKIPLQHTMVMETGGMKGRKKEMLRQEVHEILAKSFAVKNIHSEYGMTEMLSQSYSKGDGIFECSSSMQIFIKDIYDPFQNCSLNQSGRICVIDLANIYSCSFIATDDIGIKRTENTFEILGRLDNSDVRGCNLMAI